MKRSLLILSITLGLVFILNMKTSTNVTTKVSKKIVGANRAFEVSSVSFQKKDDISMAVKNSDDRSNEQISRFEQDRADEMAMLQLEHMRSIPGAQELVDEVTYELERDPDLINFDNLQSNEMIELDENFYEKLIPNPEFRKKWLQLMAFISNQN